VNDLLLARRCAALAREKAISLLEISDSKDSVDPHTLADIEAERAVRDLLLSERPEDIILGEELGGDEREERTWLIDPVDGTINFIRSLPGWSSAIALREKGNVLVSAIATESGVFYAARGEGAFSPGGERIKGEDCRIRAPRAVVATYLDGRRAQSEDFLLGTSRLMKSVSTLRAIGAGSYDLLLVAQGQVDAMVQYSLAPWDRAPGELMVIESGGAIRDIGEWFIASRSGVLAEEIAGVLSVKE